MNIGQTIARIINNIAREPGKAQKPSVSQPSKPAGPTPPARFTHQRPSSGHAIYNARGQLRLLANFRSQFSIKESQFASMLGQKISQDLSSGMGMAMQSGGAEKSLETVVATLLQQSFDLIRDYLRREREEKRKRGQKWEEGYEESPDEESSDLEEEIPEFDEMEGSESEQLALKLLHTLLEHVSDAEDHEAFCKWAHESIERTHEELSRYYDPLPPETERTFDIMEDAVLALRNGVSPGFIFAQLQNEIGKRGGPKGGFETSI